MPVAGRHMRGKRVLVDSEGASPASAVGGALCHCRRGEVGQEQLHQRPSRRKCVRGCTGSLHGGHPGTGLWRRVLKDGPGGFLGEGSSAQGGPSGHNHRRYARNELRPPQSPDDYGKLHPQERSRRLRFSGQESPYRDGMGASLLCAAGLAQEDVFILQQADLATSRSWPSTRTG